MPFRIEIPLARSHLEIRLSPARALKEIDGKPNRQIHTTLFYIIWTRQFTVDSIAYLRTYNTKLSSRLSQL